MDEETRKRIEAQDVKIKELRDQLQNVKGQSPLTKAKWYIIVFILLPLVGLAIAIPLFINFYMNLVNY